MASSPFPQTIVLTERVPVLVRLAPEAADFLLAGCRHAVALAPTRRRHCYRLTPLGHVGVLPAPGVRLVVRPKLPLRNVFFMLDPEADPPAADDASRQEPAGAVLGFLAGQLARRMVERAAAGLHRGYAEGCEAGPFLRGRIDVPAQLREPRAGQLHCIREEFTADVPCNRAPVATAERLLRSPLVGEEARATLRRALDGFPGVSPVPAPQGVAAPAEYRPLLDLCQLLDEAMRPGEVAGSAAGPAFLLDLGRVFERYVAAGVAAGGRAVVRVQPTISLGESDGLLLRPDLLIERDGRATVVADTKWKRTPASTRDVYQVIAYATALGAGRAVLVYPGRRGRRRGLDAGPIRLEMWTLDVCGTPAACRRSLRRLAARLTAEG
jgi:5-methylcytosine-specific restriction enzyme subunit McrC